MRISIQHSLRISPKPGTAHMVLQLLLTPRDAPTQRIESWRLDATRIEDAANFTDAYGNLACLHNEPRPDGPFTVTASGIVETSDRHGVLGRLGGEPVPALFTRVTPLTRVPVTLYGKYRGSKESRLDVLHGLMLRVSETLGAITNAAGQTQSQSSGGQSQSQGQSGTLTEMAADGTPVSEPPGPEVVARLPRPPATDYAHMFVGAARGLNIPARYVTGYLLGDSEEPASFHAWAEAFDEKLGWIGFDAMLELCPTDRHVRLAVGLDALSAAPLRCVPAGDGVEDLGVSIEQV